MKRILAMLMSLAFAASANAAGQAETPAFTSGINFDELSVGDLEYSGDTNWLWQSTSDDDDLRVTAWDDGTYSGDRPDKGGATNYLKIETEFSTPLYRGVVGFENGGTTPNQKKIEDQLYFDSLVYLTPGDPSTYVDSLPEDAKIAVWLQEAENEDDDPVLCVRAGYREAEGTVENKAKTYACSPSDGSSVSTGWHRLTIRCFENVMWTSEPPQPAYVVYLDGKVLTTSEARFEEGMVDVDNMVPKCLALNKAGALFLPMQDDSTSIGAVGFAGSGAVDDIIFTDKRPGFLTAADDTNYLRLRWDENVTGVSYFDREGNNQKVSDISGAGSTDIALNDGAAGLATSIEVLATYADNFGPGTWSALGAGIEQNKDSGTFTVAAGETRPMGNIVSVSEVMVAEATVTIGAAEPTTLKATTLSDLANDIADLFSELPDSATVYIKLNANQKVVLSGFVGDVGGQVYLGTSYTEDDGETYLVADNIVWTLDLNGKTITVEDNDLGEAIICDGKLIVTDTSDAANGAIVCSDAADNAIYNQGDLTINAGRFDGRVSNADDTTVVVFNGGKYLIGEDTNSEYLSFLNGHKGEGVAEFAADADNQYYVASDKEPEPTVIVAKIGEAEYETLAAAFAAAVEAGEATVDVIADVEVADSLTIAGSGIDATKITINVAENVTVTSTANYGLYIDGATVTLGGAGQWVKKANGGLILVGEKSAAAHLVVDGATIIAKAGEEAGSGVDGATRVINVQNGAVTVKSGLIQNDYIYGCCVRSEDSEVTNVSDGTTIIVEGGTLTVPTTGSFAPVIVRDGSDTTKNKIYILATGSAKFAGPEAKIVGDGMMEDYLAVLTEDGDYAYTEDYKFVLNSDGYYTATYAYKPVDAGSETECSDEAAAEALRAAIEADKANLINTPKDAPDTFDKAAYVGLFEVKVSASATETGKYVVAVVLTEDATNTIQAQVDAYGKLDLSALATANQDAALDTTPGIYYTVFYGTTPTAITSHQTSVLATATETTLKFPTQGSVGFYRVKATVQPIATE